MATPVNAPRGAVPAYRIMHAHEYVKGTNAAIYPGDFVKVGTDGKAVVATAGAIELIGVALGYQAAASTTVLVADDPDQLFYLQDDGVGATLAQTDVGLCADLVATAGNATFLRSNHQVDTSTKQTTSANFRILGKHPADDWGKYVRSLIVINEHAWAKKTAGA